MFQSLPFVSFWNLRLIVSNLGTFSLTFLVVEIRCEKILFFTQTGKLSVYLTVAYE